MNLADLEIWIKDVLGNNAAIKSIVPLKGGMSSEIYRLDVSGQPPLVLRQITDMEWLARKPDLALQEATSLRAAAKIDVATPLLIAVDEMGAKVHYPSVLMTMLEGNVTLSPNYLQDWMHGMAEALKSIHSVDISTPWSYHTYNKISELEIPYWSKHPDQWKQAIDILQGSQPITKCRFIHRDYHPANILFKDNKVSGIVDWINACIGPAGIDVGHCRLNLALLIGTEAANLFLQKYIELMEGNFEYHPYWDLLTLIEFLPGPPEVYRGWVDLGVTHLNNSLMTKRMDEYLVSIMKAVHSSH